MSAPDTNVEKQAEKHKTPLIGMGSMVAFAAALLLLLLVWIFATGNEPGEGANAVEATPSAAADNG